MSAQLQQWFHNLQNAPAAGRGQSDLEGPEYYMMVEVISSGLDVPDASYVELHSAFIGLRLVEERMAAMQLCTSKALAILVSMYETPAAYAVLLAAIKAVAHKGLAKTDAEILRYLKLHHPWPKHRIDESLAFTLVNGTSVLDDFAKFDAWLEH